jgi:hypothetical protein
MYVYIYIYLKTQPTAQFKQHQIITHTATKKKIIIWYRHFQRMGDSKAKEVLEWLPPGRRTQGLMDEGKDAVAERGLEGQRMEREEWQMGIRRRQWR